MLLKADRLNVWPLNNAPGAVLNLMNPSNVDTVFIAGKARKWRGNLVGVDVPRVLRLVAEARDGVVWRSGFMVDAGLNHAAKLPLWARLPTRSENAYHSASIRKASEESSTARNKAQVHNQAKHSLAKVSGAAASGLSLLGAML